MTAATPQEVLDELESVARRLISISSTDWWKIADER
jgi:hypothetical protein